MSVPHSIPEKGRFANRRPVYFLFSRKKEVKKLCAKLRFASGNAALRSGGPMGHRPLRKAGIFGVGADVLIRPAEGEASLVVPLCKEDGLHSRLGDCAPRLQAALAPLHQAGFVQRSSDHISDQGGACAPGARRTGDHYWGPHRSPAKRVRWGEEEQGSAMTDAHAWASGIKRTLRRRCPPDEIAKSTGGHLP